MALMGNGDQDYLFTCQISGLVVPYSETKLMWNGLRVWYKFWKPRNPLDFMQIPPVEMVPTVVSNPSDLGYDQYAEDNYFVFQDNTPIIFNNNNGLVGAN